MNKERRVGYKERQTKLEKHHQRLKQILVQAADGELTTKRSQAARTLTFFGADFETELSEKQLAGLKSADQKRQYPGVNAVWRGQIDPDSWEQLHDQEEVGALFGSLTAWAAKAIGRSTFQDTVILYLHGKERKKEAIVGNTLNAFTNLRKTIMSN